MALRQVKLLRAQPIAGAPVERQPPILQIDVEEVFPRHFTTDYAAQVHAAQGDDLCTALCASLPGGTVDALLRALLERRASELRVPLLHGDARPDVDVVAGAEVLAEGYRVEFVHDNDELARNLTRAAHGGGALVALVPTTRVKAPGVDAPVLLAIYRGQPR